MKAAVTFGPKREILVRLQFFKLKGWNEELGIKEETGSVNSIHLDPVVMS